MILIYVLTCIIVCLLYVFYHRKKHINNILLISALIYDDVPLNNITNNLIIDDINVEDQDVVLQIDHTQQCKYFTFNSKNKVYKPKHVKQSCLIFIRKGSKHSGKMLMYIKESNTIEDTTLSKFMNTNPSGLVVVNDNKLESKPVTLNTFLKNDVNIQKDMIIKYKDNKWVAEYLSNGNIRYFENKDIFNNTILKNTGLGYIYNIFAGQYIMIPDCSHINHGQQIEFNNKSHRDISIITEQSYIINENEHTYILQENSTLLLYSNDVTNTWTLII